MARRQNSPAREDIQRMDIQIGDVLVMKKNHPCGGNRFEVLRTGVDFKLKCLTCGHEIMVPRLKIIRHIHSVEPRRTGD